MKIYDATVIHADGKPTVTPIAAQSIEHAARKAKTLKGEVVKLEVTDRVII